MTDKRVSTTHATPDEIAKNRLSSKGQLKFREGDDEEAILLAMARQINDKLGGVATTTTEDTPVPSASIPKSAERLIEPETQALEGYKRQFSALTVDNKPEWEVVKGRLTADGNKKLKLAMALEQTVIFGVDSSGQILFSDGGNEVPEETKGKDYYTTKSDVMGDKYEFFDTSLMRQWEFVTRKHFVRSTWSWLKSEDLLPSDARCAYFASNYAGVRVYGSDDPRFGRPFLGARRLLRV